MGDGSLSRPNGRWFYDHLLSLALLGIFLVSWVGQFYFQYRHEVDEARSHGARRPSERHGSCPRQPCVRRDGPRRFLAHHLALPPGTGPSGWRLEPLWVDLTRLSGSPLGP